MKLIDGRWNDVSNTITQSYAIEWDASEVLANYTFAMTDTAGGRFSIDENTGKILVADGHLIDYESATTYNVTVEVTDSAGNTYSEMLPINIDDALELSTAPTDLSSGIELNTDGGNNAYLVASDGGAVLGGAAELTVEVLFSSVGTDETTLISYLGANARNDLTITLMPDGSAFFILNNVAVTGLNGIDYSTLQDGNVHAVALTWDNTNGDWTLHVDGVQTCLLYTSPSPRDS